MPPQPPKPPHLKPHHHNTKYGLFKALISGTLITIIVGFILNYLNIGINVILPVLAPIWVGSITLFFSIMKDK